MKTPGRVSKAIPAAAPASAPATAARETSGTHRPVSFPPRDVERPYGFPSATPELPVAYGVDRFVLMTRNPEFLFAYWEITPARQAASEQALRRGERYHEALRLTWPARDIFEQNFAMLSITFTARKWYLHVPFPGLSYQAELGWLGESGHFVPLLASNSSDAPESRAAAHHRLSQTAAGRAVLAHAARPGGPHGSSDLASSRIAPAP